ncbi:MAG: TIGR03936 family radical SAM-associated protein [Planctomycetota bacterium]|nr:TIGR03936 family radical SAM-associated protein [Planctomycetota bacterium]
MSRQRYRIRFCKQGDLRWISHRDLLRTLERLFRRADFKLAMTEGFHPRPRMSFASALALGVAALDEVMELELAEAIDATEVLQRLQQHTVAGLEFTAVEALAANSTKGRVVSVTYEYPVPEQRRAEIAGAIQRLLGEETHWVARPGRKQPVEVRRSITRLELTGDRLLMHLTVTPETPARPRELLAAIGLGGPQDDGEQDFVLTRTAVELANTEKS